MSEEMVEPIRIKCLNCGDLSFWPDWICAFCYGLFPKALVDALPVRGEWMRRLFDRVKGQGEEGISVVIGGLDNLMPDEFLVEVQITTDISKKAIPVETAEEKKSDAPNPQDGVQGGVQA